MLTLKQDLLDLAQEGLQALLLESGLHHINIAVEVCAIQLAAGSVVLRSIMMITWTNSPCQLVTSKLLLPLQKLRGATRQTSAEWRSLLEEQKNKQSQELQSKQVPQIALCAPCHLAG